MLNILKDAIKVHVSEENGTVVAKAKVDIYSTIETVLNNQIAKIAAFRVFDKLEHCRTSTKTFIGIARLKEGDTWNEDIGIKVAEYKLERQFWKYMSNIFIASMKDLDIVRDELNKALLSASDICDKCTIALSCGDAEKFYARKKPDIDPKMVTDEITDTTTDDTPWEGSADMKNE